MADNNASRDEEDATALAANSVGQITARQSTRLKATPSLLVALSSLAAGVILVVAELWLVNFAWPFIHDIEELDWLQLRLLFLALWVLSVPQPLLWLIVVCRPFARWVLLQRDLAEGRIVQQEGHVAFRQAGYRATIAGRSLKALDGSKAVNLVPGAYRFSYLPHSGRLLLAQRLPDDGAGAPYQELLETLAQTNHFDLNDLALNRQGRLSGRQARHIARSAISWGVVGIGLALLGGWVALGEQNLWGWGAGAVLLLVTGVVCYTQLRDLPGGRVLMLEGLVDRRSRSRGRSVFYSYVLNGKQFDVGRAAYHALVIGIRYRVYYTPNSHLLTSIEPVPW